MPAQLTKEDTIVLAAIHCSSGIIAAHGTSQASTDAAIEYAERLASALHAKGYVLPADDLRKAMAAEMLESMMAKHRESVTRQQERDDKFDTDEEDVEFDEMDVVERDTLPPSSPVVTTDEAPAPVDVAGQVPLVALGDGPAPVA